MAACRIFSGTRSGTSSIPTSWEPLPDVFVPDASVADWQALFDLVQARNWKWHYCEGSTELPLPSAAVVLARPADAEVAELRIWPKPGVLAIFRMMSADEIDFDVDLRDLQGQPGVDALCSLLAEIGRELGKPVKMTPEGGSRPIPSSASSQPLIEWSRWRTRHSTDHRRP